MISSKKHPTKGQGKEKDMKSNSHLALLTVVSLSILCQLSALAQTEQIDLISLSKKASPAVMLLVISDSNGKEVATGTGFLISAEGKLITSYHVIEKGPKVVAKAGNGGLYPVEGVLASDPKNDLAMLMITGKDLPFLKLSTNNKTEVGTRIAIIGSPLGLEGSMSEGIVSAVRDFNAGRQLIQLTAAISPGSSGSPVLDAKGLVIGIASSFLQGGQALNFAVPAEAAIALVARAENMTATQPLGAAIARDDYEAILDDSDYLAAQRAESALDYAQQLRYCQNLVRRYPDNYMAHKILGDAYVHLNLFEDAIAAYKQAVKWNQGKAKVWYNMGLTYFKFKKFDKAITAFMECLAIEPDLSNAWFQIGSAYFQQKKYRDAIYAYRTYTGLAPNEANGWLSLGVSHMFVQDFEGALEPMKRCVDLKPENASAQFNLAIIYINLRRNYAAEQIYNKLLTLDPILAGKLKKCLR
jgi:tetratricopeptide (TPR) repeat protein